MMKTTAKYEKLLSIAASVLAKKGYNGTSLQDIADKIGLHKSSLFHYIKNKEQLLLAILSKPVQDVNQNLTKIIADKAEPEEKLLRAMDNHLTLLIEHLDTVTIYLNDVQNLSRKNRAVYVEKRKEYEKNFQKIIEQMMMNGYFSGADPKILTFGLLGMLNWTAKWYNRSGTLTAEDVAATFRKLINLDMDSVETPVLLRHTARRRK